jgi:chorismate--pyruvate lyase
MARAVSHARWVRHVNAVNPTPDMRRWLTDKTSLTVKLIARSKRFRVQRLRQQRGLCLADESAAVGLPRRRDVNEREVLLRCDEQPVVFAHTIVPLNATSTDWPFFGGLGERSLGTTLFGDPRVKQGNLQFARLRPQHPLARRASAASGAVANSCWYARRCLYRRKRGLLLVTEVFLPAIAALRA